MSQRAALFIASIAGAVGALTPIAAADWWLSTVAYQTHQTPQTQFFISAEGNWTNWVIGGGEDSGTNAFFPVPKRNQFYDSLLNQTNFRFYEAGGQGIWSSPTTDRRFGIHLLQVPQNMIPTYIHARWSPNTEALPIVPFLWAAQGSSLVVTITNPSPSEHIFAGFAGYCPNRGISVPQQGGNIPPMAELTPIPEFFGVLPPGQSRIVEIPGPQSSDLVGFYAKAWWGDAPGPEELSLATWMGGTIDSCYPDCNANGSLTVADFTCFQTRLVAGDPYADCNQSGTLTVADFTCFQTKFVAGCP